MKRRSIVLLTLLGSIVGYFVGNISSVSGWELFYEIFMGAALFLVLGVAFLEKEFSMFVGAIIGLVVAMSLDWIAGSPVDIRNKLSFMGVCSFVAWLFRAFWKQVFVGGLIGGGMGFVWGMLRSHWFGKVCVPPGLLNASLLFIQLAMLGMSMASLYMKIYGWQFLKPYSKN